MNDLVKLGVDLAKGRVVKFSNEEATEELRKGFRDLMEYQSESNTIDRKTFRKHKIEIFEIIEEILNETIHEGLKEQFADLVEYKNLAWGDKNEFYTPAKQIFRVALVSDGNGNLRRQKLRDGQTFSVGTKTYGVMVGEEFHKFLAGRLNWNEFIANITESFEIFLKDMIYGAIINSFGKYSSTYHISGNVTEDQLVELALHVKARTGADRVAVYGTLLALRTLAPSKITEAMANGKNVKGFYGEIAGIELHEIEQSHKIGTDEFAISDKMLLVLPIGAKDKMVKIVNEGDAIVQDEQGGLTSDMMQEYMIANKFGIAVIPSQVFGMIMLP